ncbi:hypothetical protein CHRYSEOSP005_15180 [Chryseobacterium sp. Alg-005]|uniref:hypothetical protein n=1 Tax=Chryseobacterium sp. Alg-005 TaxID=3159516 RepID=UPI0035557401
MSGAIYSKPNNTLINTGAYDEWVWYDFNGNITQLEQFGGMFTRARPIDIADNALR